MSKYQEQNKILVEENKRLSFNNTGNLREIEYLINTLINERSKSFEISETCT